MGCLDTRELRAYADAETCRRERPRLDIGVLRCRQEATLTRIEVRGGEPTFIAEASADVYFRRRQLVTSGGELGWWRLEVVAPMLAPGAPGNRPCLGDEIVVSEFPWSSTWLASARFKGRNHDRGDLGAEWPEAGDAALARLERLDHDPFLTDPKLMVAGISDPALSFEGGVAREQRGLLSYAFGWVRDREQVVARLLDDGFLKSQVTLAAKGLLEDPWVDKRRLDDPGKVAAFVPIELRDEESIREVMDLAIQQALAGPGRERDVEQLAGKPVKLLAKDIFFHHISRMRKAALRRRATLREASRSPRGAAPAQARSGPAPEAPGSGPETAPILASIEELDRRLANDAAFRRQVAEGLLELREG